MKTLGLIFILLAAHSAFAADYRCSKVVSEGYTEFADINTWPLEVTTSYQRCTTTDGIESCETGSLDVIASSTEICGLYVGSKGECVLSESTVEQNNSYRLEVNCKGGTQLLFETYGKMSEGEISCNKNGKTVAFWNVGPCAVK